MRAAATATASLAMLLGTIGEPARADDGQALAPFQPQAFQYDRDFGAELGDHALNDWRMRRAEFCLQVDEQPTNNIEGFYAAFRQHAIKAPLMNQLFHDVSGSDITLCHGDVDIQDNRSPYYRAGVKAAVLPMIANQGYFLGASSEEMRHAWQDHHGMITGDDADSDQSRQAYMAEVFMAEADGATFAVATAYQLREAGDASAWAFFSQSDYHAPIAQAFEASLRDAGVGEGDAPSNAQWRDAMRAGFTAWYEDGGFPAFYADYNAKRIEDRADTTRTAGYEIAVLSERLEGLPTDDRPDVYIGPEQVALAVNTAFDQFPPPALQQGFRPAATGPASGPE